MGNKRRLPASKIVRLPQMEQRYGIQDMNIYAFRDDSALIICGEIVSESIKSGFGLKCNVYDQDGDLIETQENCSYGSGMVTCRIAKKSFFNGFPFRFHIFLKDNCEVSKIQIIPM